MMKRYLVRVQLDGEPGPDVYEALYERLLARNVYRRILGDDGVSYDLPNATYQTISAVDINHLLGEIVKEAEAVWRHVEVFVAQFGNAAWQLKVSPTP